jgi:carbonic anhydrase
LNSLYNENDNANNNLRRRGPAPAVAKAATAPATATATPIGKVNPQSNTVIDDKELSLVNSGWLRVSSKSFISDSMYPQIMKPDFTPDFISVEEGSTVRINNSYNQAAPAKDGPPNKWSFFFRLSLRNLYYSFDQTSLTVLGSIPVANIVNVEENNTMNGLGQKDIFCFYVRDKGMANWELCSETRVDRANWMCKIKAVKKIEDPSCQPAEIKKLELAATPVTEFERKVTQPIILIPQPAKFCNEDYNYEARGSDWECTCKEGLEQSPINIDTSKVIESPVAPVFSYTEVEVKKTENTSDGQVRTHKHVKLLNHHQTLKIKADSFGTVVTLDGTTYNASKVIFHTPSEHKINGKQYPMEMQIIHKGVSEGAVRNHLVLSFLFVAKPGVYNKFLDDVDFFNLPNVIAKERNLENDLYIPKIFYSSDNEDIPIMKPFSMYTYQGSLTYPPCSELTINYIAADPIEVGPTILNLFKEAIRYPDLRSSNGDVIVSTSTGDNNRNTQPLNGRNVFYYNVPKEDLSVLKKRFDAPKVQGHYEKVVKNINNYYWVNNNKPSGMPGSLVVSDEEAKGNNAI